MRFNDEAPIYEQIATIITVGILVEGFVPGDCLPSVRELASMFRVNPITAMKSLQVLVDKGIARSERGLGYYVTEQGYDIALQERKEKFFDIELPQFFESMDELQLSIDEVVALYTQYSKQKNENPRRSDLKAVIASKEKKRDEQEKSSENSRGASEKNNQPSHET